MRGLLESEGWSSLAMVSRVTQGDRATAVVGLE